MTNLFWQILFQGLQGSHYLNWIDLKLITTEHNLLPTNKMLASKRHASTYFLNRLSFYDNEANICSHTSTLFKLLKTSTSRKVCSATTELLHLCLYWLLIMYGRMVLRPTLWKWIGNLNLSLMSCQFYLSARVLKSAHVSNPLWFVQKKINKEFGETICTSQDPWTNY